MSDQAQIVYSITEQEPAWINLILFSPFFIIGLIAVFFESKEFINKRKNNAIKTKDCALFYVKIIFSLVVSLVIASGLLRYFFSLNAYQYALKNNNYEMHTATWKSITGVFKEENARNKINQYPKH